MAYEYGEFMKKFDSNRIRKSILNMAYSGATVHIGCAFSIVELVAVLYRSHLKFDYLESESPDRDYLVLSKGHGIMAQYACLNEIGWIADSEVQQYFKNGTRLKGLADVHVPGVEATTGSLGHGVSVAVGLALASKLNKSDQIAYTIVGDGEMNEGAVWEAILFSAHFHLDNFVLIVDKNGFQAMGSTDEVMQLGSIEEKLNAFGFDALTIDGHDEDAIDLAYGKMRLAKNGKPKAIIANTTKGHGVSFMENNNIWHYTRFTDETHAAAIAELNRFGGISI